LALLVAACVEEYKSPWPDALQLLSVNAVYPDGYAHAVHEGAVIRIEEVSSGATYLAKTDSRGLAEIQVPPGIYRITCSDRTGKDLFNGAADKVVVTERRIVDLRLAHSTAGGLVVKEIYTGGCSKEPQEGTYQSDKYLIIHNNDLETVWLDSLCIGTLAPYNSTAENPWADASGQLPAGFVPIIQAVWMVPGEGSRFPLGPGQDAIICLNGAIDHSAQYPRSVNLDRPDCFVCYNPLFTNANHPPAPGPHIRHDQILELVIKVGQANAYTISVSSPTAVIFKARGTDIYSFVKDNRNLQLTPGSTVDWVVTIPTEWVLDGVEVFDGRSSNNGKRLISSIDAGYVTQSEPFKSHSLLRNTDEPASAAFGFEVLQDTNNSSNDFHERETQTLHDES
jgi:hypothetical protein